MRVHPTFQQEPNQEEVPVPLTRENYRYIQNTIAGVILDVRNKNKTVKLEDVCEIIVEETRNIESVGVEYVSGLIVKRSDGLTPRENGFLHPRSAKRAARSSAESSTRGTPPF
jgi:hypothetical protein